MEETRNFMRLLKNQWALGNFIGVSLDPILCRIPAICFKNTDNAGAALRFIKDIFGATCHLACCYQFNLSFFQKLDIGTGVLAQAVRHIKQVAPAIPIILDGKFNDTLEVNQNNADFAFGQLKVDAVTVNHYFGQEANSPFLDSSDKGVIVLCRTSNPGSQEFQDALSFQDGDGTLPFYKQVAWRVSQYWNKNSNCGLIVGARYPQELRSLREMIEQRDLPAITPIFIQGIGRPGVDDVDGTIAQAVVSGQDSKGNGFAIISSRAILYASSGANFADAASARIQAYHKIVSECRT